jgi:hypothetical protein
MTEVTGGLVGGILMSVRRNPESLIPAGHSHGTSSKPEMAGPYDAKV